MATLAVQAVSRSGLLPVYGAADVAGDAFKNSGREFIHVKNDDDSSHTVTVAIVRQVDGLSPAYRVVTIPTLEERMIGPFPPGDFNNVAGLVTWAYDDITDVTVAVVRL